MTRLLFYVYELQTLHSIMLASFDDALCDLFLKLCIDEEYDL